MPIRFFAKIVMIVSPFICIFLIFTDMAGKIGNSNSPLFVIKQQQANQNLLYLPTWERQDIFFYKIATINYVSPDVLLLGSSRMYHWRLDYMFNAESIGYNASIGSIEPIEIAWIIENLANQNNLPEVIILGIDDPFFNQDATDIRENRIDNVVPPLLYNFMRTIDGVKTTAQQYTTNPVKIARFYQYYEQTNFLGSVARDSGRGFRFDGGFQIPQLGELSESEIQRQDDFYTNNQNIFQRGDSIYQPAIDAIEDILTIAVEHDITVIGIISPYNSSQFNRMMDSGEFSYLPEARQQVGQLFAEHDMPLLDFTDATTIGGTDDELYDYWHPGEVLSLRIYNTILRMFPDTFEQYSDAAQIEAYLNSTENPFYLPELESLPN